MFKLQNTELNSFALSISSKNRYSGKEWLSTELAGLEKEVSSGGSGYSSQRSAMMMAASFEAG